MIAAVLALLLLEGLSALAERLLGQPALGLGCLLYTSDAADD